MEKALFFRVPSSTNDGSYIVRKMPDGEFRCGCPHFIFREKWCKHIKLVIKELKEYERI